MSDLSGAESSHEDELIPGTTARARQLNPPQHAASFPSKAFFATDKVRDIWFDLCFIQFPPLTLGLGLIRLLWA